MKIRAETRRCVAVALLLAWAASTASAFDLGELMRLLAQKRSGEGSFVEQRYVKGLDQPLRTSGTIGFVAPDRFTRTTLEPRAESMVVDGNTVVMKRGGRSRSLALDAVPEMAAIVEAVRGTVTGNAASLQRFFRPALGGDAEQWVLDLTPLDTKLYNLVRIVRIGGHRSDVLNVEVQLADGDRSVMVIEPQAEPSRAAALKAEPPARAASTP